MNRKLYLECNSGISGDMTVAALIDLGADQEVLQKVLTSLPVPGFSVEISRVKKAGLDACDFRVNLDEVHENHDHDMEYLHGHEHHHDHEHSHDHQHSHEHRCLKDILEIITHADMTENAKNIAVKTFEILAEAEAKAHGSTREEVHFHEVGGVDSIVDIIAAAVCLDNLNITEVVLPILYEGTGYVRCMHGMMPIPVPAVANIAAAHGLRLHRMECEGEFVTPTGAAIAAAIRTKDHLPKQYRIEKIGMGAGKRSYERPSILRGMFITEESMEEDVIYKLESNIDDCSGEALGYVMERLFENGARDVHYFPVFMKKNRPGYQLNVICDEAQIEELEQIIFKETTTIGIRRQKMQRSVLKREQEKVMTSYGEVEVKKITLPDGIRRYPEYESIASICRQTGKAFLTLQQQILRELGENPS